MFNPIVYLVDGFRWTFFGIAALGPGISFSMTLTMLLVCVGMVMWIFKTGYRLRT